MARASTPTKLSLDSWAAIMGINPLHFNQVFIAGISPPCNTVIFQHEWQRADAVGREAIARAIAEAEAQIETEVGYRLLPSWEVEERHPLIRPARPELVNLGVYNQRGYRRGLQLRWGKWIAGGRRATTTIAEATAVTFTDGDGDGYSETATVTVTTDVADCEIRVFYPGHAASPQWEVRPVTVVDNGDGTKDVVFRREQIIKEKFMEQLARPNDEKAPSVDGSVDANFLDEVDVVRVRNDPSEPARLLWEPDACACGSTSACAFGSQTACLSGRDPDGAFVAWYPAVWDADNESFTAQALAACRSPDQLQAWYYAGHRNMGAACPETQMDPDWAYTVAILAASKLDRAMCGCDPQWLAQWREDLAFSSGAEQVNRFRMSPRNLDNPWGTRRGAVEAWNRMSRPGTRSATVSAASVW